MTEITGYHAHVYFDADSDEEAVALCEAARDRFAIKMGRVHRRPVGPHPKWSCQLSFGVAQFAEVVPWLMLHRGATSVFVHPETGDDYLDHTDHQMWLGPSEPLKLADLGGG